NLGLPGGWKYGLAGLAIGAAVGGPLGAPFGFFAGAELRRRYLGRHGVSPESQAAERLAAEHAAAYVGSGDAPPGAPADYDPHLAATLMLKSRLTNQMTPQEAALLQHHLPWAMQDERGPKQWFDDFGQWMANPTSGPRPNPAHLRHF